MADRKTRLDEIRRQMSEPNVVRWRKIVENSVTPASELVSNRSMVVEMASTIKDFIDDIESIRFQLAQNWCLCKWCQMFDPKKDMFNHWKSELVACIMFLRDVKLKSGSKMKTIMRTMVEKRDFDDVDIIYDAISYKFAKEGISDEDSMMVVSREFVSGLPELVGLMSETTRDKENIVKYMERTFIV